MAQSSRLHLHAVLIGLVTIALLWFFFRGIDLHKTWLAITQAHVPHLIGAVIFTLITYVLRSIRWMALLRPIGTARFRSAWRTTVVGFAANFLLPGRAGEVLRAYLLARQEGFSAPATFATVIVERLLDIVTVLTLLAIALIEIGGGVSKEIKVGAAFACVVAFGGLVVMFFMAGHPERLGRWVGKLSRWLPHKIADALSHFVRTFAEGLAIMRRPTDLAVAMLWSVPIWLSISVGIWLAAHAFDLTVPFTGSFLIVAYLTVGVTVPTPGGAGGFHLTYKWCVMTFFAASDEVAVAAGTVLHAISFVPITLIGLVVMWQDGLSLGTLREMRSEAKKAEEL